MHRIRTLAAGCAMAVAAPLTIATTTSTASAQTVTPARVGGDDRYATAAEVARFLYPDGISEALLGSGTAFPDALAGAPLAGANNAPVLLTDPAVLSEATADALDDLGVDQVTLLGGPDAVSPAVEQELERRGHVVGRVAGRDRFDTAAELARAVYAENTGANYPGGRRAVFVANGHRFPDALAASAPASAGPAQVPIVLVEQNRLPETTAQVMGDLDVDLAILVGGSSAVSESVRRAIEDRGITTERIGGRTRTDTATNVAAFAQEFLGFDPTSYLLARGDEFPDALAAGPLGGVRKDPVLLTVGPGRLSSPTSSFLTRQCPAVEVVRAVGGQQAVANGTLQEAQAAAESCRQDVGGDAQDGQSYLVAPQEPLEAPVRGEAGFSVLSRTDDAALTGPADVALLPCGQADIVGAGDDIFADRDGDGAADGLGSSDTGAAVIVAVDGAAAVPDATVVRDQRPDGDGRLDVAVRAAAQDCAVLLVWDDADGDGQFDVTAEGRPAEPYGVGQVSWR